jgi:hypothetical protein
MLQSTKPLIVHILLEDPSHASRRLELGGGKKAINRPQSGDANLHSLNSISLCSVLETMHWTSKTTLNSHARSKPNAGWSRKQGGVCQTNDDELVILETCLMTQAKGANCCRPKTWPWVESRGAGTIESLSHSSKWRRKGNWWTSVGRSAVCSSNSRDAHQTRQGCLNITTRPGGVTSRMSIGPLQLLLHSISINSAAAPCMDKKHGSSLSLKLPHVSSARRRHKRRSPKLDILTEHSTPKEGFAIASASAWCRSGRRGTDTEHQSCKTSTELEKHLRKKHSAAAILLLKRQDSSRDILDS